MKYNLRRQTTSSTSPSRISISLGNEDIQIKVESDDNSMPEPDMEMFRSFSTDTTQSGELNIGGSSTSLSIGLDQQQDTTMATPPCSSSTSNLISASNATALIALQQLASISSTHSMERLAPNLPKELLAQNESLVYAGRPGKRLPRQSSKRLSQFETNRCPLCARVYRSQAFLNEHMRKEHSILI